MKYEGPSLTEYLADALDKDYFVVMMVTSQTKGLNPSINLPYGLGKTSLAWWLSYKLHAGDIDAVRRDFYYYPSKMFKEMMPSEPPKPAKPNVVYDDVQATAPAVSSVPSILQRMAGFMSTERPEIKTLTMTGPNINAIAAPLRKSIAFELIVYERGKYEVQQITYTKNYSNPHEDLMHLDYKGQGEFDAMPPAEQKWYDAWRREQKIPQAKKLVQDLEKYEKRELPKELSPDEKETSEAGRRLALHRARKEMAPEIEN